MKNIIKTSDMIYYRVCLMYGKITVSFSPERPEGPYSIYDNFIEADTYSLNILRQNVAESEYKTGSRPKTMNRTVLGVGQVVNTESIIPTMKYNQEQYPECFL